MDATSERFGNAFDDVGRSTPKYEKAAGKRFSVGKYPQDWEEIGA
jgi:hypothetical protein